MTREQFMAEERRRHPMRAVWLYRGDECADVAEIERLLRECGSVWLLPPNVQVEIVQPVGADGPPLSPAMVRVMHGLGT